MHFALEQSHSKDVDYLPSKFHQMGVNNKTGTEWSGTAPLIFPRNLFSGAGVT